MEPCKSLQPSQGTHNALFSVRLQPCRPRKAFGKQGQQYLQRSQQQCPGRRLSQLAAGKAMEISVAAEEGSPPLTESFSVSEGGELFTVSLKKPLGLVLAEQNKKIIVEEVADGSAGQDANIKVGDILRGTTARSKNIVQENVSTVEARNKQSFLGGLTLMQTDGEKFETVMAAIMSSKCSSCDVTLVLERPKDD